MTDIMECDVLIVGGGPAGLSAAIKLRQLDANLNVILLEKGSEIGAHILSGAVMDPVAINELIPDWKEKGAPLNVAVTSDRFSFLTARHRVALPTPPQMKNHGNYIISLANLCRWLGQQAEGLGVQIFAGFPAAEAIIEEGAVKGVRTGAFGIGKNGEHKASYQPPMELRAKITLFGEGCRGSLSEQLMKQFKLREDVGHASPCKGREVDAIASGGGILSEDEARYPHPAPRGADLPPQGGGKSKRQAQTYGIGIKEIWQVAAEKHRPGLVEHSVGWPMNNRSYGGSFLYHLEDRQVAIGFVVGLDYKNPFLDPFKEFQRFKTHPAIRPTLEGGKRLSYGARALNEGGWQSIPKLTFPGGALIGCAAGFLNVPRIKGSHLAMKSGMLAAEAVVEFFKAINSSVNGDAGRAPSPLAGEGWGEGAMDSSQPHPRPLSQPSPARGEGFQALPVAAKEAANHGGELAAYETNLRNSWVGKELYGVRNVRPAFAYGLWAGMLLAALDTYIFRGRAPWTLKHRHTDHGATEKAAQHRKIDYPAPDGVVSFDRTSSVYLSNTNHEEDQPCHLLLRDPARFADVNLPLYDAPEQRYCPAGVYEVVEEAGAKRLQINAQNCVHCKTCDIKDMTQNIQWKTPEGGGGPNYGNM